MVSSRPTGHGPLHAVRFYQDLDSPARLACKGRRGQLAAPLTILEATPMHQDTLRSHEGQHVATVAPVPVLIETRWRFTSPGGRILACKIYETAGAFEVRVGYRDDDPLYSRRSFELDTARSTARELRLTVVAKGRFTELPA